MHIQKTFSNLIGLLIPFPIVRRHVKQCLMRYDLCAELEFMQFCKRKLRENSVCLIEINGCHGEVLAGIIPLLKKAGCKNIDIAVNADVYDEKPFCRLDMHDVHVYRMPYNMINRFINSDRIKKYKHLFLMSSACYHIQEDGYEYSTILPLFRKAGLKPVIIEHDLKDVSRFNEEDFLAEKRLVTLGKFDKGIFINPHDFGEVREKVKSSYTTFVTVGNLEAKRKNFHQLIETINMLVKKGKHFKVVVIGRGNQEKIPSELRQYIHFTGRLKFPQMYKQLEKADFFLPLLDADNPLHERYITSGVTGSAQLIYGFIKVPVIDKKFAGFYRFNRKNAIVYDKNLASGMLEAIEMSPERYSELCEVLKKTASDISEESIGNLQQILSVEKI